MTVNKETRRSTYTHQKLRSGYSSLASNLELIRDLKNLIYLTLQTIWIEGYFLTLKIELECIEDYLEQTRKNWLIISC